MGRLVSGVGQYPQMSSPTPGPRLGWREHASARRGGMRPGAVQAGIGGGSCCSGGEVVEAVQWRAGSARVRRALARATLAHRVRQSHQIVLIGMGGQRPGVPHQLPPARCGDATGVPDTQIPRMGFPRSSQRTDHRRRVRVDERQRRYCIVRTPGPTAATGYVHDRKAIVDKPRGSAGHAHPSKPRCSTVTIGA